MATRAAAIAALPPFRAKRVRARRRRDARATGRAGPHAVVIGRRSGCSTPRAATSETLAALLAARDRTWQGADVAGADLSSTTLFVSRITVVRIALPAGAAHGYGSSLVPLPGRPHVLLSVPHGRAAFRLATLDVRSRSVHIGRPVRGEVRDGVFDAGNAGWLLTTSALCRLDIADAKAAILSTVRPRGLGTYQHRLFALGHRYLGVCGWASKSLAVIDQSSGEMVKRLAMVAPHQALVREDRVLLLAPHGGEVIDLDLRSLTVRGRWPMPFGTQPLVADGHVFMLTGERRQARGMIPIEQQWKIAREQVCRLDLGTLEMLAQAPAPAGSRDALGIDHAGRLVLSSDHGLVLLDARDLGQLDRIDVASRWPLLAHAWLPHANTAVGLARAPGPDTPGEILTFTW
jgi:hypothetical protein